MCSIFYVPFMKDFKGFIQYIIKIYILLFKSIGGILLTQNLYVKHFGFKIIVVADYLFSLGTLPYTPFARGNLSSPYSVFSLVFIIYVLCLFTGLALRLIGIAIYFSFKLLCLLFSFHTRHGSDLSTFITTNLPTETIYKIIEHQLIGLVCTQ